MVPSRASPALQGAKHLVGHSVCVGSAFLGALGDSGALLSCGEEFSDQAGCSAWVLQECMAQEESL